MYEDIRSVSGLEELHVLGSNGLNQQSQELIGSLCFTLSSCASFMYFSHNLLIYFVLFCFKTTGYLRRLSYCSLYRGICSTDKIIKNLIQPLIPPLANGYADLYKEQKDFETLKKCGKEEFFGLRDFYRYKCLNLFGESYIFQYFSDMVLFCI